MFLWALPVGLFDAFTRVGSFSLCCLTVLLPFPSEPARDPLLQVPIASSTEQPRSCFSVASPRNEDAARASAEALPANSLLSELLQCLLTERNNAPGATPVLDPDSRRDLSLLLTSVDLRERAQRELLVQRLTDLQARLRAELFAAP